MNIIVSNDKSIRLTQYSSQSTYNLTDINFYISKELSIDSLSLGLMPVDSQSIYTFEIVAMATVANYFIYRVTFAQNIKLSAREYKIILTINDEQLADNITVALNAIDYTAPIPAKLSLRNMLAITADEAGDEYVYPYGLTDEHEPIDIVDRTIQMTKNKNTLVAEDNVSQCLTFRLPKFYDGIDLSTKRFFFDYLDNDKQFLSLPIYCVNDYAIKEGETLPENIDYLALEIAIPYEITSLKSPVSFAISAIDMDILSGGDENGLEPLRQYVWQTQPATLTIAENLGTRPIAPIVPEGSSSGLETLIKDVEALKNSDIYGIDAISNDNEVIFGGGGAPIE